jgi:hypothetical protein
MRVCTWIAATAALLAMLTLVPGAGADQTFHTQRIALMRVAAAPGTGFVVDVHVNGPQIYALERYVLIGAAPSTTYQVQLLIYGTTSCTENSLLTTIPTAALVTNLSGNGEARWTFRPSPTIQPGRVGIVWQVLAGDQVAYQTACIVVTLD